jgi:ubiquinone/menaquinone biosynthesis C-methylase UbiE
MTQPSVSFDRAADYYDQTRELSEAVAEFGIPAILDYVKPGGRILDVGTGTGRISVPMLRLGADLIGVDLSLKMMGKLREKYSSVRLAQTDASRLPFPAAAFDAVLTTHVLHLIGPWREALREFKRVVKPGGVYLNAWHHHQDRSVGGDIRDYWRSRVDAHGGNWRRPGVQERVDVLAALMALGSSFEEIELLRYTSTTRPNEMIEQIARRVNSDAWPISDEVFEAALRDVRAWAAKEYGNLDQPVSQERRFILQVTRFN